MSEFSDSGGAWRDQTFRRPRRARCRPRCPSRRCSGDYRAERLRQDHTTQCTQRRLACRCRFDSNRRQGTLQTSEPHRIARLGLARTFQNIRIFNNLSVIENVKVAGACNMPTSLFGIVMGNAYQKRNEAEIEHRAREALEVVGLGGRADDRAAQLPYAQQRLLEIARALASKPDVLLLDQPAAGMNMTESMKLLSTIVHLKTRGITILLVEHNVRLVMGISDRVRGAGFRQEDRRRHAGGSAARSRCYRGLSRQAAPACLRSKISGFPMAKSRC